MAKSTQSAMLERGKRIRDDWLIAIKKSALSIEVEGLVVIGGGSIEDPNVEPWFHVIVCSRGSINHNYDVVTKDGITFSYLRPFRCSYLNRSRVDINVDGYIGRFLQENRSLVQDAFKHYVLCGAAVTPKEINNVA